ncbi:hypothetical protein BpHYR1_013361, partial [Brachionus plicatilis]
QPPPQPPPQPQPQPPPQPPPQPHLKKFQNCWHHCIGSKSQSVLISISKLRFLSRVEVSGLEKFF